MVGLQCTSSCGNSNKTKEDELKGFRCWMCIAWLGSNAIMLGFICGVDHMDKAKDPILYRKMDHIQMRYMLVVIALAGLMSVLKFVMSTLWLLKDSSRRVLRWCCCPIHQPQLGEVLMRTPP